MFAWWLADRIATLIGSSTEVIENIRRVAIIPDAQSSEYAWRLSNPRTAPSILAKTTHLGAAPWALSILSSLTEASLGALKPGLDAGIVIRFERSFAAVIMLGFPIHAAQHEDSVYAFESTLTETVNAWQLHREGTDGIGLANAIASMYEKLSKPSEFAPALQKISEEDELSQLITAHWAMSLALQDVLSIT